MSENDKRPYEQAAEIAHELVDLLRPACLRIEIAGSLRRRCATIGDIEIVAVPRLPVDLLGDISYTLPTQVDLFLRDTRKIKDGHKYKQFEYKGMTIDLFLQPDPATWGVNFLLRTGSAMFSKWLVTKKRFYGAMPENMRVKDGRLWRGDMLMYTPEEADVFEALGLPFIKPVYQRDYYVWLRVVENAEIWRRGAEIARTL